MSKRKRILTQEEIIQLMNKSDSEWSDLSDDDDVADKTFEADLLEGQSSSDELDEEKNTNISKENTILDHSTSSKSPALMTQSSNPKPVSANAKRMKKEKKQYKWDVKKFISVPHSGPLGSTHLQALKRVRTPLQYFSQYFPNHFFQEAAFFTNQYSVFKTGKSLKTNGLELKSFLASNLIMGCMKFPRLRMYWQTESKYPPVADLISRSRFLELRNAFHVVDVTNPPSNSNENKLWKVQPILDAFRKVCLNFPRDHVSYSIDEQMIPFTGLCPVRQFVKNKPRPIGLKNFVLCTSTGLVLDFELYQGQSTRLVHPELGFGPSIILRLAETLPPKSFLYFDRYFTTLPLLEKLNALNIFATGTNLENRISVFEKANQDKMERGTCIEHVTEDNKIVIVEWKDSKKVIMASNCCGTEPRKKVERWSKTTSKYIEVSCPSIVKTYDQCMGGVDVCDQQMEYYRTWFKTSKWTWKVILHFVDLAVTNSWFQYKRDAISNKIPPKNRMDLLKFKLEVAQALVLYPSANRLIVSEDEDDDIVISPVKRSKYYNPPAKIPCQDKRYDLYNHFPCVDDISRPCKFENCKSSSKTRCEKCNVYLCISKTKTCFKDFHCKKINTP